MFRPRSASKIVTTVIKSTITRGILAGLNRPLSMSSIKCRHFKTFILQNKIIVKIVGVRMSGLTTPISKTSITIHHEITCSAYRVGPNLLVWPMSLVNELRQNLALNWVRCTGSMVLGTGLLWSSGVQWNWGWGLDECAIMGISLDSTVSVIIIGAPHGDFMITGFVWL